MATFIALDRDCRRTAETYQTDILHGIWAVPCVDSPTLWDEVKLRSPRRT